MSKKTLVIGASTNPERYSFLAVNKLLKYNHPVVAVGLKSGEIATIPIETSLIPFENIDTVTLYVNPTNQKAYYDYILSLQPNRIIFNPGTENEEFEQIATKNNIEVIEACTLVMLSTNQY
jgi:predicted CoA-binding protein